MSILKILTIPDPGLRQKSKGIKKEEIPALNSFISQILTTMTQNEGVGLAAPQVGKNIRLVVISQEAAPDKKDRVLINPKITKRSWRKETAVEGCLSVPGEIREISRCAKINVEALSALGKPLKFSAAKLFARVIQHEIDHLNGILIIDK